jgi:hypothetical protein
MTLSCCAGSRRKYWIVACVPRKERASSGSVDKSSLRPCSPSSSRARRCWPWLPYLLGVNGDAAADLRARACGGGPQGSEFDVKSLLQQKTLAQLQGNSIRRRQQRQDAAGVYLKQAHDSEEAAAAAAAAAQRTRTSARSNAVSTTGSKTATSCRRAACTYDTCSQLFRVGKLSSTMAAQQWRGHGM